MRPAILSVGSNPLPATEGNPLGENIGLTSECPFVVAEYQEAIAFQGGARSSVGGSSERHDIHSVDHHRPCPRVLVRSRVAILAHSQWSLASLFETVSLIIQSSKDVTARQPFAPPRQTSPRPLAFRLRFSLHYGVVFAGG